MPHCRVIQTVNEDLVVRVNEIDEDNNNRVTIVDVVLVLHSVILLVEHSQLDVIYVLDNRSKVFVRVSRKVHVLDYHDLSIIMSIDDSTRIVAMITKTLIVTFVDRTIKKEIAHAFINEKIVDENLPLFVGEVNVWMVN